MDEHLHVLCDPGAWHLAEFASAVLLRSFGCYGSDMDETASALSMAAHMTFAHLRKFENELSERTL